MKRIISTMCIFLIMTATFVLGGFTYSRLLESSNQTKIEETTNDKEKDSKENNKSSDKSDNKSQTKEETTNIKDKQNKTKMNKTLTIQDAPGFDNADRVGGNYDNKCKLEPGGYFTRCNVGHSIYTMNGDWDCGQCQRDSQLENNNYHCPYCGQSLGESDPGYYYCTNPNCSYTFHNEATDFDWEGNVDWSKYE